MQPPGPGPVAPQGQTVIVQYVNAPNFGHNPVNMVCPHCQAQIRTSTDSEPGPMAWILAGVLCVVGLWLCACIPCCIDSLNSVTHKCPNCKNFLEDTREGFNLLILACLLEQEIFDYPMKKTKLEEDKKIFCITVILRREEYSVILHIILTSLQPYFCTICRKSLSSSCFKFP